MARIDLTPLRGSRDFRLLFGAGVVTYLGSMFTLRRASLPGAAAHRVVRRRRAARRRGARAARRVRPVGRRARRPRDRRRVMIGCELALLLCSAAAARQRAAPRAAGCGCCTSWPRCSRRSTRCSGRRSTRSSRASCPTTSSPPRLPSMSLRWQRRASRAVVRRLPDRRPRRLGGLRHRRRDLRGRPWRCSWRLRAGATWRAHGAALARRHRRRGRATRGAARTCSAPTPSTRSRWCSRSRWRSSPSSLTTSTRRGRSGCSTPRPSSGSLASLTSGWTRRVHRHGRAIVVSAIGVGTRHRGLRPRHEHLGRTRLPRRRRCRRHVERTVPHADVEPDDSG